MESNNWLYDPNKNYGQVGRNQGYWSNPVTPFNQTQVGESYLNWENPEAGYTQYLANQGFGGMDGKNKWARGIYGQQQNAFNAAVGDNPDLLWTDFLKNQNLNETYGNQSNSQKGIDTGRSIGKMRWQPRV